MPPDGARFCGAYSAAAHHSHIDRAACEQERDILDDLHDVPSERRGRAALGYARAHQTRH